MRFLAPAGGNATLDLWPIVLTIESAENPFSNAFTLTIQESGVGDDSELHFPALYLPAGFWLRVVAWNVDMGPNVTVSGGARLSFRDPGSGRRARLVTTGGRCFVAAGGLARFDGAFMVLGHLSGDGTILLSPPPQGQGGVTLTSSQPYNVSLSEWAFSCWRRCHCSTVVSLCSRTAGCMAEPAGPHRDQQAADAGDQHPAHC